MTHETQTDGVKQPLRISVDAVSQCKRRGMDVIVSISRDKNAKMSAKWSKTSTCYHQIHHKIESFLLQKFQKTICSILSVRFLLDVANNIIMRWRDKCYKPQHLVVVISSLSQCERFDGLFKDCPGKPFYCVVYVSRDLHSAFMKEKCSVNT